MNDVTSFSSPEKVSTVKTVGKTLKQVSTKDIPLIRAKLLAKQNSVCPICKNPIGDPVLDHDHQTGAVRDTLCRNCNRFEGKVLQWVRTVRGDNIELLKNLARYWKRHHQNRHGLIHPGRTTKRKKRKRKTKLKSKRKI